MKALAAAVACSSVLPLLLAASRCAAAKPAGSPDEAPSTASSRRPAKPGGAPVTETAAPDSQQITFAPDIGDRLKQLPLTRIDYGPRLLPRTESNALRILIAASHDLEEVFLRQVDEGNADLRRRLTGLMREGRPEAPAALDYFDANLGPWDRLKADEPFIGTRAKPKGAAFYPPDMTKEEFERWIAAHPEDRAAFQGLYTVIRREGPRLVAIPYSKYYALELGRAADKLRQAAASVGNESLRNFLNLRADALLSDDYYASDLAWMDLDSDIEIAIGPYEVYEDGLFNYKAAFESFITARDRPEEEHLAVYERHLADMERNLPIEERHKNLNRKFESPIRVVQEIFTAGDARRGVQTSAFNLPNDERVREAKGSKKVLLKNIMEAKFRESGRPIAERVLDPGQLLAVSFDAYFNHTLFHELSHGLGPGLITGPDGRKVEARLLLKNLYSTIEECKADVVGMWNVLYAIDQRWLTSVEPDALYATVAGLAFRSMRFGLEEAHGGGTAVQWNWFRERRAVEPVDGGRFAVRAPAMREAIRTLANELLTIEATGDFERARRLLDRYGKSTPEIRGVIEKLTDVPVDIRPIFVAAGESG